MGIATLQSPPGVPVGNANLIAPRGTIDAGAGGIRVSGNLNILALQVLNAFNIDVQDTVVGVPGGNAPNIGALSDASAASDAATKAITSSGQGNGGANPATIQISESGTPTSVNGVPAGVQKERHYHQYSLGPPICSTR